MRIMTRYNLQLSASQKEILDAMEILMQETGRVFAGVLEDAGVYKNDEDGRVGFVRFIEYVNQLTY